jgi:hypothetical protein
MIQKHEYRGRIPKLEIYPFPLMSKGEINMRRERTKAGEKEQKNEYCERDYQKKVYFQEELPFTIDFEVGEKEQKHQNGGRIGHRGSMSVSINAKGGYCWKIGCH